MDRDKIRRQARILRNKKNARKSVSPPPKPTKSKVVKGVVKVDPYTTKKTTVPPVQQNTVNNQEKHRQILKTSEQKSRKKGCGGCRRRQGGK